jgi:Tol biopolymer transport system component
MQGKVQPISAARESLEGLVWTPDGSEVWYAGANSGYADSIYAITPGKRERVVTRFPIPIKLLDRSPEGKLLFVTCDDDRRTTWERRSGGQRSLDWLGSGFPADLSQDGNILLFSQYGEAGGQGYSVYMQKGRDAAPIRLGEGDAMALSPDGNYALALLYAEPQRLAIYQYEAATPRLLAPAALNYQPRGQWFPDSRRILFEASEARRPTRIWMQETPSGAPKAVTPEGVELEGAGLNPDGTLVAARCADGVVRLFPISGGDPVDVHGLKPGDRIVRWRPDGRKLVVMATVEGSVRLDDIDVQSGMRMPGKDLIQPPMPNVVAFTQMLVSFDSQTIVYGAEARVRTLRIAEGLK